MISQNHKAVYDVTLPISDRLSDHMWYPGPALGVGRVGSRLGPQDLGGPQMPKIGPQFVAIKRLRYPNRTVTTLIEQPIIQSSRTLKSS